MGIASILDSSVIFSSGLCDKMLHLQRLNYPESLGNDVWIFLANRRPREDGAFGRSDKSAQRGQGTRCKRCDGLCCCFLDVVFLSLLLSQGISM